MILRWLLLPLALLSAAAIATPQLLFLGYDLRGLLERGGVSPLSPPAEGLAYNLEADRSEQLAGGSGFRLGYEIGDLVLLVTPPTLARKRL